MKTDQRIAKLEENAERTLQIVTEIKMVVSGSKTLGTEGMVHELKKVSEYVAKLEKENIITKVREHHKYIKNDQKQKYILSGVVLVIAASFDKVWEKIFR